MTAFQSLGQGAAPAHEPDHPGHAPINHPSVFGSAGIAASGTAAAPANVAVAPSSNPDITVAAAGEAEVSASAPSAAQAAGVPTMDADFYRCAVAQAGIPVVPMDVAGRVLGWNAAAVRMFARNEADVLGKPLEALISAEFRAAASEAFQRTLQQRSVNFFEMHLIPEGGKNTLHVGVTLSCVVDDAGILKGVAAWLRDITNRKELELHLDRTRHMASVGTLAAGVAHHFNNIAAGMSTMVEFALATEDPGAMNKALLMSKEACTRIRYITQSLLDCSGTVGCAGHASTSLNPEHDLSDLTEEILGFADAVEPTLNQKGIRLELDLRARRITAVPRIRFGQVLQHLLRNAEDAIEERCCGMIGAERRITIRTHAQGEQVMVAFSDTGMGIEPADLPRIFDPFFTKKGVQGGGNTSNPGLGLTLVHTVIVGLGGHIWADSLPGHGTAIHILVPVAN